MAKSFFIFCFYTFCILSAKSQTSVVIEYLNDEIDTTKYFQNPFVGIGIKENAFKDGAYVFYLDEDKKHPFYKGIIRNGKTDGYYYLYKKNTSDDTIIAPKNVAKVKEGRLDSICEIKVIDETNIKILYNFHSGVVFKISVVDPIISPDSFEDIEANIGPAVDSVNFMFDNEKLTSINFNLYVNSDQVKSLIININDTVGTKNVTSNNHWPLQDSSEIKYIKHLRFTSERGSDNNLNFYYDSNHKIRALSLIVGLPVDLEYRYYKWEIFKMELDDNGFLKMIQHHLYNKDYTSYIDEQGNERPVYSGFIYSLNLTPLLSLEKMQIELR